MVYYFEPNVVQHCLRLNLSIYLHGQNAPAKLMMFEGLIVIFVVAIIVCVNGLNLSLAPTDTFAVAVDINRKWPYTVSNGLTVCLLVHTTNGRDKDFQLLHIFMAEWLS